MHWLVISLDFYPTKISLNKSSINIRISLHWNSVGISSSPATNHPSRPIYSNAVLHVIEYVRSSHRDESTVGHRDSRRSHRRMSETRWYPARLRRQSVTGQCIREMPEHCNSCIGCEFVTRKMVCWPYYNCCLCSTDQLSYIVHGFGYCCHFVRSIGKGIIFWYWSIVWSIRHMH